MMKSYHRRRRLHRRGFPPPLSSPTAKVHHPKGCRRDPQFPDAANPTICFYLGRWYRHWQLEEEEEEQVEEQVVPVVVVRMLA